jgi:hypothetical protein
MWPVLLQPAMAHMNFISTASVRRKCNILIHFTIRVHPRLYYAVIYSVKDHSVSAVREIIAVNSENFTKMYYLISEVKF